MNVNSSENYALTKSNGFVSKYPLPKYAITTSAESISNSFHSDSECTVSDVNKRKINSNQNFDQEREIGCETLNQHTNNEILSDEFKTIYKEKTYNEILKFERKSDLLDNRKSVIFPIWHTRDSKSTNFDNDTVLQRDNCHLCKYSYESNAKNVEPLTPAEYNQYRINKVLNEHGCGNWQA